MILGFVTFTFSGCEIVSCILIIRILIGIVNNDGQLMKINY
jgi:hypothetical protein